MEQSVLSRPHSDSLFCPSKVVKYETIPRSADELSLELFIFTPLRRRPLIWGFAQKSMQRRPANERDAHALTLQHTSHIGDPNEPRRSE